MESQSKLLNSGIILKTFTHVKEPHDEVIVFHLLTPLLYTLTMCQAPKCK